MSHSQPYRALVKAFRVINSCETLPQLEMAKRFKDLVLLRYPETSLAFREALAQSIFESKAYTSNPPKEV